MDFDLVNLDFNLIWESLILINFVHGQSQFMIRFDFDHSLIEF